MSAPPRERGRSATRVVSAVCWFAKGLRGSGGDLDGALNRRGVAADRAVLRYLEDQGGHHSEADWARRVGPALEFLLA